MLSLLFDFWFCYMDLDMNVNEMIPCVHVGAVATIWRRFPW